MARRGAWSQWRILPKALPYLRPYRGWYIVSILITLVASLTALAEPWPLAVMVDSVLGSRPPAAILRSILGENPDPYTLLPLVVGAGFFVTILGHGLTVVGDYVNAKQEQNMVMDLRSDLFSHAQKLSMTFHDSKFTGQLMSQINTQAHSLGQVLMAFPPMAQNLMTLVGMLAIAILIDWQVTLISLIAVPFIYYSLGLYGTRIVPRIQKVMQLEFRSLSIVFEAMSMLRVIVSYGREEYEHRRFLGQGRIAVKERVKLTVRQTMFSLAVTAATAAGTALVLGFGAWHVLKGEITIGQLLVLMSYISSVYQPLEQLSNMIGHLNQDFVFLNASFKLLETEPEIAEKDDAVDIGRARGRVTFDKVAFTYQGREETIRDVSFEIEPGQRVAIVGPTGAGKTTLASLMVRFYDPKRGRILYDGHDLRDIQLRNLRENVSLVLQEPLLFSGTITDNIRYGRLEATMEEVVAAARHANAHDFISHLPDGYETELGERGAQLSGGERQRIAVARAFIKDAPILILDDPTSSIDSKTENVILDALDELMLGRTSFLIAHRLSTVRDADLILVMNHGDLVEMGSHEELLARDGLYAQLCSAQGRQRARKLQVAEAMDGAMPVMAPPTPEKAGMVRQRVRIALAGVGADGTPGGLQIIEEDEELGNGQGDVALEGDGGAGTETDAPKGNGQPPEESDAGDGARDGRDPSAPSP
jgi:ATP-binding cassette subfamily B protein